MVKIRICGFCLKNRFISIPTIHPRKSAMEIFVFFVAQIGLCVLSVMLILDLARLATFLFYEKSKHQLAKNIMIRPVIGTKIWGLKNIFALCFILPTFVLLRGLFGMGLAIRWTNLSNHIFLIAYFSLFLIFFCLIAFAATIGKKLQIETSRKQAKLLFMIEIVLLVMLFLILLTFNQLDLIKTA